MKNIFTTRSLRSLENTEKEVNQQNLLWLIVIDNPVSFFQKFKFRVIIFRG